MSKKISTIDLDEFIDEGYLQEVNRRFLHPLGLALAFTVEEDGSISGTNIWDFRDDPEGIQFNFAAEDHNGHDLEVVRRKAQNIRRLQDERSPSRIAALGFFLEPIPGDK